MKDVPLEDIPLEDIPLEDIPLEDIPLEDIPLEDIPLEDIPLEDIPLEDVPLEDVPLEDVPLKDVPLKDVPLKDENANILAVLNLIILREYALWTTAMNSTPQDFPGILKTSSSLETCVEIAEHLGLQVVEPIVGSQVEELKGEDTNT